MRALLLALVLAAPAWGLGPGEALDDPALEARARALSAELRCPVCRNESIDESAAPLAADIRRMVREGLTAGRSDAEVRAAVVARYGEFVLLRPTAEGANLVLWLAPAALLLGGLGLAAATLRRRAPEAPLSAEEERRLSELLREP